MGILEPKTMAHHTNFEYKAFQVQLAAGLIAGYPSRYAESPSKLAEDTAAILTVLGISSEDTFASTVTPLPASEGV